MLNLRYFRNISKLNIYIYCIILKIIKNINYFLISDPIYLPLFYNKNHIFL